MGKTVLGLVLLLALAFTIQTANPSTEPSGGILTQPVNRLRAHREIESVVGLPVTSGVPTYQPGWPVVVDGVFRSSPAFADINSDGVDEIIVGCGEKVYVWTAYGARLSGWPQNTDGEVYSSPAVADIDSDGELEVIVGSWWGKVYAWKQDGELVNGSWPRSVYGRIASSPAIGDIDQDGELEIVIASYYGSTGVIYGFEADGSDANGWPVSLSSAIKAAPALADIDNDTRLEIVIGAWESVYAFNGEDASTVPGWPVGTYGDVRGSAAIGDIDEDGALEIVVGDGYWGGHAWVFEANGSVAAGWPINVENNVVGSPSLADLDDDGDLEIIMPSSIYMGSPNTSKLWVWHHNGQPFGSWPVAFTNPFERATGNPIVVDIDADNELEIILGTGNGSGICPNLYAFNLDTTLVSGWPLQGRDIYVSCVAGDVDNDGKVEIAAGSWSDYTMHCWELEENTSNPALTPWPKFHHDLWNTGNYEYTPPPRTIIVPDDYLTIQEAINAASDGDTVFARNGTYYENVVVNKSISLLGENRENTVIASGGVGTVIQVDSDNVTIGGFEIRNCSMTWGDWGITLNYSSKSVINGNIVKAVYAICVEGGSNNIIKDNNVVGYDGSCVFHGLQLINSSSNIVSNNNLSSDCHSALTMYNSSNNSISFNHISGHFVPFPFTMEKSSNNSIVGNTMRQPAPLFGGHIYLTDSKGNVLYHNSFLVDEGPNIISIDELSINNTWDNGCEGNYWSDYAGVDNDNDGIGDAPYHVDINNTDNYPLISLYWDPADINHDLDVDIFDVVSACAAYSSTPSDPHWNCHCDIAEPYGIIDIFDIVMICMSYGEEYTP